MEKMKADGGERRRGRTKINRERGGKKIFRKKRYRSKKLKFKYKKGR